MALRQAEKTEKTDQATAPIQADTVLLSLNFYQNYSFRGELYEAGRAYRFTKDVAVQLLGMMDGARSVWKLYHPPQPKVKPKNIIEDKTGFVLGEEAEPIHGIEPDKQSRIDLGNDEEIADILNRSGDVTV